MEKMEMEKMEMETPDITSKNIEKIGELFPNVITEIKDENGKLKKVINFETLKQMLSPDAVWGGQMRVMNLCGLERKPQLQRHTSLYVKL